MNIFAFKYFLLSSFGLALLKSAIRGGTSEFISFIFAVVGLIAGLIIYQPNLKYILISVLIFSIIYIYGLFIAMRKRKSGPFEMITGVFVGIMKFFFFLTFLVTISIAFDLLPPIAMENEMIKMVYPHAKDFKENYLKYFLKNTH